MKFHVIDSSPPFDTHYVLFDSVPEEKLSEGDSVAIACMHAGERMKGILEEGTEP
jgi:hypothetical protein